MTLANDLNYASAVVAIIAAALWFRSATIRTPKLITSGYGGVGGLAQELGDAIGRQSRWSAAAAVAAGIAALLQALATFIGTPVT